MVAKLALQIDLIGGVHCDFIESLLCRAQTCVFGWAERIKEREAKGTGSGRLSVKEQARFGGLVRQATSLMICPALIDFVKAEAEKGAKLQKALMMVRETREAEAKKDVKHSRDNKKDIE